METGKPSQTALRVAMRRAVHQMLDRPLVFEDPIAVPLLRPLLDSPGLNYDLKRAKHPVSLAFRSYLVARSRYAEDQLAGAVAAGIRQYVVLGAGLDTFAYRNLYPAVRVYEVDFPATQAWKRELLAKAGIAEPREVTYAPVDFERMGLAEGLARVGFEFNRPTFLSWLGVTMYLTLAGFRATIETLGSLPEGTAVTFDYSLPRELLSPTQLATHDALAERVAAAGEPFQLSLSPRELDQLCGQAGFHRSEHIGATELNERYFQNRTDGLKCFHGAGQLATFWR